MSGDNQTPQQPRWTETEAIILNVSGPVGSLHPQPWMTQAETRAVIAALNAGGHEVRFIGGCVRDAILKRPVKDIDLALSAPPDRVTELLTKAGVRVVPTGIAHGTVTAVIGHVHFEITSLRVDVETFGRHARVEFTDDWARDAARRDFTINAMSCTADGTIYDYFGGLDDLAAGLVRFVGDPVQRIHEDALRLLRFFRFFAVYGEAPADQQALSACRERAADVARLSVERVRGELMRILMAPEPADVLQLMRDNDVLVQVLPEAGRLERLRRLCWLESHALARPSVKPDPTRRLAALFDADGGIAERLAERLKFSIRERKRLIIAAGWPCSPALADDPKTLKKTLHRTGAHATRDVALIQWADELIDQAKLPRARTEAWLLVLDTIDAWRDVSFPLKGRDCLALGVSHGRSIGQLLRQVEDWWEEGGYVAGRAECLDRLETAVRQAERQARM